MAIGTTTPTTPTTQPATPTAVPVTLFLVRGDHLVAVQRSTNGTLGGALGELLAGPSTNEAALGLNSAVPAGTKLQAVSISASMAQLNFNDALTSVSGQEQLLAFAQIVATATSIPGVQEVQIAVAGQEVNAPRADGTLAQGPVSRADYAPLFPR